MSTLEVMLTSSVTWIADKNVKYKNYFLTFTFVFTKESSCLPIINKSMKIVLCFLRCPMLIIYLNNKIEDLIEKSGVDKFDLWKAHTSQNFIEVYR